MADAAGVLRFFAAAAEAAGADEAPLPAVATVGELRALLIEQHGERMARVLAAGSFLVNGTATRDDAFPVAGPVVDVLPPFTGG